MRSAWVLLAAVAALSAYYVYLPLPGTVSDPWKLMLLDATFRIVQQTQAQFSLQCRRSLEAAAAPAGFDASPGGARLGHRRAGAGSSAAGRAPAGEPCGGQRLGIEAEEGEAASIGDIRGGRDPGPVGAVTGVSAWNGLRCIARSAELKAAGSSGEGRPMPLVVSPWSEHQACALPQQRSLREYLRAAFQYLKRVYKKAREGILTRACGDRTRGNGFKLKRG